MLNKPGSPNKLTESTNKTLPKFIYLKKGEGKLASNYHGETEFSKKRKEKIIREQEERQRLGYNQDYIFKI
tara:strand:- start:84 stop:296 length:213 start_codon:yes stop_codon:yes gene_type:complete